MKGIPITVDLDEGRFAEFACVACHAELAKLTVATPARLYVVSLDCVECSEQLVEFDQFRGITMERMAS
jgi:hypothetical protein